MTESPQQSIRTGNLVLEIGPVRVRVETSIASVMAGIEYFYSEYPVCAPDSFADFFVRLHAPAGLRRWWRPQVNFFFDRLIPFKPLPLDQAFPFFEWGLNWCVAQNCHQYLIIHAAVLERQGAALILPGFPGAGKSTLTAALVLRGWRLLSDELTLCDIATGELVPIPRPISLKNASIDIVAGFDSQAAIGESVHDTSKGTVAHMRVPATSIERARERAVPKAVIFPHYQAGNPLRLAPLAKGLSFMQLAELAFNYNILGTAGFKTLHRLMSACDCYRLEYDGDLEFATHALEGLVRG